MGKVITLDESGSFLTGQEGICFVGGFYKEHVNYEEEQQKMEKDLREYCQQYTDGQELYMAKYPESLHGSEKYPLFNKSTGERITGGGKPVGYDGKVEKFKKKIQKHVIDYLREHKYKLYAYVIPEINQINNSFSGSNILAIDNNSSNLYEQMAMVAVFNHIFYSLTEEQEDYYLDLATRVFQANAGTVSPFYEQTGSGMYKSTTMGTYKTAISTMLYEHIANKKYENVNYYLNVESINYHDSGDPSSSFLYMTDLVCSYLLKKMGKKFGWNKATKTYSREITAQGFIELSENQGVEIRIYDDTDAQFRLIIENIKEGNLAASFASRYDIEHSNGKYKKLYQRCWLDKCTDYLNECLRSDNYRESLYAALPEQIVFTNRYMNVKEFSPNKGLYIAEKLIDVIKDQEDYREKGKSLFKLYDIQLRGYNHRGSVDNTLRSIEFAEVNKIGIPVDEYCEHFLRVLEYYFNSFQFDKAKELCERIQASSEALDRAFRETACISRVVTEMISPDVAQIKEDVFQNGFKGKIYSTIGQADAFLKDYDNAERAFENAFKAFRSDFSNIDITKSYLLHMYIVSEDKGKYENVAAEYFEAKQLLEQWKNAKTNPFAILVFTKAFNVFYSSDINNWGCLKDMIKWASESSLDHGRDRHPFELIYKHVYEAFLQYKNFVHLVDDFEETKQKAELIKQRALNCIPEDEAEDTLRMIWMATKIGFCIKEGTNPNEIQLSEMITRQEDWDILHKYAPELSKESTANFFMDEMSNIITYMYT